MLKETIAKENVIYFTGSVAYLSVRENGVKIVVEADCNSAERLCPEVYASGKVLKKCKEAVENGTLTVGQRISVTTSIGFDMRTGGYVLRLHLIDFEICDGKEERIDTLNIFTLCGGVEQCTRLTNQVCSIKLCCRQAEGTVLSVPLLISSKLCSDVVCTKRVRVEGHCVTRAVIYCGNNSLYHIEKQLYLYVDKINDCEVIDNDEKN